MSELKLTVKQDSEVPIYVQVKNQIRLAIDKGTLTAGKQMPTVRNLAVDLGINANTVNRIYADLERDGYLQRRQGIGTFAVDPHEGQVRETPGQPELKETIRQLRSLGYSDRQIIEMTAEALSAAEE